MALKICIFGTGAIGGFIAGHLERAGQGDVSIVARGRTLETIRSDGLTIHARDGAFVTHPRATDNPAELGVQDIILLTLKAHQLPAALDLLPPLIGPHTALLPPTTGLPAAFLHGLTGPFGGRALPGLDPDRAQMRAMPADQVMGIVYWIGAHTSAPGVVHQDGPLATCMVGELDGRSSDRARALSDCLTAAGIKTPLRPNIRNDIWVKFVNSLCWNPVAVLTGATNGAIGADRDAIATVVAMMREADALANHIGLEITVPIEKRIAVTLSAPHHKMSMLQDFEAGRALESDVLQQSLLAMKDLADVPTPALDSILSLMALRGRNSGIKRSIVA